MRYFKSAFFLVLVGKILSTPVVIELNSDLENERRANSIVGLREKVEIQLEGLALRGAAGIYVVAPAILDSIVERFAIPETKVHVVLNGVDQKIYFPQDMKICRKELHLDENNRFIVYAGDFQRWQGIPDLLVAANYVYSQMEDVQFFLIGDGPERIIVERRISELGLEGICVLLGRQTPEDTARLIGTSNICVAPYNSMAASGNGDMKYGSFMRGSSLKILTYMACGRPVISSYFAEAGALVEELGAGIAVPPDDGKKLGKAIISLLENPDVAENMGRAGSLAVLNGYTWEAVAQKLIAAFETIIQRR